MRPSRSPTLRAVARCECVAEVAGRPRRRMDLRLERRHVRDVALAQRSPFGLGSREIARQRRHRVSSQAHARVALGGRQRDAMPHVQRQRRGRGHALAGREARQRELADRACGRPQAGIRRGQAELRGERRIRREAVARAILRCRAAAAARRSGGLRRNGCHHCSPRLPVRVIDDRHRPRACAHRGTRRRAASRACAALPGRAPRASARAPAEGRYRMRAPARRRSRSGCP